MLEARQVEVEVRAPCRWVEPKDNLICMLDATACSNCNEYEPRGAVEKNGNDI